MQHKDFIERHLEYLAAAVAHVLGKNKNDVEKEEALKGIASLKKNMPAGDGRGLLLTNDENEFEQLMESPYFQDNRWTLLKEMRNVFEIEAELLAERNDTENAAIVLAKAEKIHTFLLNKGLFVWGEEDKSAKYEALKKSIDK